MPRDQRRRFTLLDVMILVAAAAVAAAMTRGYLRVIGSFLYPDSSTLRRYWYWSATAAPTLEVGALAWLVLRLRHPRPRLRHVARLAGTVACAAATLEFLVEGGLILLSHEFYGRGFVETWGEFTLVVSTHSGLAVAGAWLALAMARRWRAEPTWIDRGGRALGVAWIAFALAQIVLRLWS
jgi:hypothetical protein